MKTHTASAAVTSRTLVHGKTAWVDFENPSALEIAELETRYHLHPVHLKESVQQVQHNQVEHEENYLFFVLHLPRYEAQTGKLLVNQVGIFLGKDFLITIRTGKSPIITTMFSECQDAPESKEDCFKHGPAFLLYTLISRLLADIFTMTESVISELDSIEDVVFNNTFSDAQRIGKLRQKIVRLSRVIGPKKLILDDLTQSVDAFTGQAMAKYFSNNTKTVNRLWEVIEEAKETVEIFKDADFTTSTEQTNRILAVLTLIFTFTIPVTVVGTLYGMNILLPGSVNGTPWTFWGKYTTFALIVVVSSAAAIGMYLYFKRKKWF